MSPKSTKFLILKHFSSFTNGLAYVMSSSRFKPSMSVSIPTLLYKMGLDFLSVVEIDTDTGCHEVSAGHFKKRLKGFVVWKIVIIEKTHQLFLARGAPNYEKTASMLPCFQ